MTVDPEIFGSLPVVFFDHDPSCMQKNAFCVIHDSAATAQMAVKELLRSGYTEFAFVPYLERCFWSEKRERVFLSALAVNGCEFHALSCCHSHGLFDIIKTNV